MTMKKEGKDFDFVARKKYDTMYSRCYTNGASGFKSCGAKGIKMEFSWANDIRDFKKWLEDELAEMEISKDEFVRGSHRFMLTRKDSRGHYTPKNCRISSPQQVARGKLGTKGKVITCAGGEKIHFI